MNNLTSENTLKTTTDNAKSSLIVGLLAGLAASACCAGPLILLMLGISGSWIGNLSALEPYRPFFILLAAIFLGLAYRKIFIPLVLPTKSRHHLGTHFVIIIFILYRAYIAIR
ncbi:MAG: mercury transporter MerT [Gammaproteobacteria bacterium]|nr:mercury transporter MerT [Gammaproteobacteria bacterium]